MRSDSDVLNKLLSSLKQCSDCTKMVESRCQVMGEDHYPCSPAFKSYDPKMWKYFLIGIAPGRMPQKFKKKEEDNAFKYGSGLVLHNIFDMLDIADDVYITNTIKCNTPKDNIFEQKDVERCIVKYLVNEINIIRPEKIIVLGGQARDYFMKYLYTPINRKVTQHIYFTKHPAYYMRRPDKFNSYLKLWEQIVNEDSLSAAAINVF